MNMQRENKFTMLKDGMIYRLTKIHLKLQMMKNMYKQREQGKIRHQVFNKIKTIESQNLLIRIAPN